MWMTFEQANKLVADLTLHWSGENGLADYMANDFDLVDTLGRDGDFEFSFNFDLCNRTYLAFWTMHTVYEPDGFYIKEHSIQIVHSIRPYKCHKRRFWEVAEELRDEELDNSGADATNSSGEQPQLDLFPPLTLPR